MSRFDAEKWRLRAVERFSRAGHAQRDAAAARLSRNLAAIEGIDALVAWCTKQGIVVGFDEKSGGAYTPGQASVNSRLSPERLLHVLLHECGHHVVAARRGERRFICGYEAVDVHLRKTTTHRIDVLHEELEAWYEGALLAERIKTLIDRDRFNRTRAEYIKSYLRWVLRERGYERGLEDEQPKKAWACHARRGPGRRLGRHARGRDPSDGAD